MHEKTTFVVVDKPFYMLPEANADSKSEFIRMAVEFYIGYLRSEKTANYMAPIIAGTIKSEIRGVEKNLSEMIFKLAVEQGIGNNLLAAHIDADEEDLEALHESCARTVAETNGIIDMNRAYRWQGRIFLQLVFLHMQDKCNYTLGHFLQNQCVLFPHFLMRKTGYDDVLT